MLTSAEVRSKFLEFFRERGHAIVRSSSVVPANDPTLLFANSGMVQFKDVFLGVDKRPYSRATTAQKCMRVSGKHNDLEEVGPSARHNTFFEMLGNFSFGDYFKRDAITYAWTFLTEVLGLDASRLWPTVHPTDDEAFELWQEIAHLPASRITRLEENLWAMGDTGPCGPDSEIMWDRGVEFCTCGAADCSPAHDKCARWLEIWNLVFMQFEQRADGTRVPLARPSIDTGMGLERMTSVLQGVQTNYDTDLFIPIIRRTQELLGHDDATVRAHQTAYRVIADHSRAITFLIADGVLPGNEGRSYITRLILRRAARFGKLLGFDRPFLAETAQVVIDLMGHHYVDLVERQDFIKEAITREEERFLTTLTVGLGRLDALATRLKGEGQAVIPGDEAFKLYDTYGFPLELTRDAAQEAGMTVDEAGFKAAMAAQKERARSAAKFALGQAGELYRALDLPKTRFLGYETGTARSHVVALVKGGESVEAAQAGDEVEVVLAATPFYAESGGQVGDTGEIASEGARLTVSDTVKPIPDLFVHQGKLIEGTLRLGDAIEATVDMERRLDIARNHTATHLLHRALRTVLGEHAAQKGSLVSPERLRFDFAHLSPMTPEEIEAVERLVNEAVRRNYPVATTVSSYDEAVKRGAIALFGEKYGDVVRAVAVEGYTTELCGGTHLHATGEVGAFVLLSESSVGSGLRRIEALTGRGAEEYLREQRQTMEQIGAALGARPGEELARVQALLEQQRADRKTIQDLQRQLAAYSVASLTDQAVEIKGAQVLAAVVEVADVNALRELADRLRDKLGSCVVALGALIEGRPLLVVAVTPDLIAKGLSAGKLAGAAAGKMGGGGGGKPNMAQAGGKDASKLAEAVAAVPELVASTL